MPRERITREEGLDLFHSESLLNLRKEAHRMRMEKNPKRQVTYVLDSNPNYTNICEADCTFCSFYRKKGAKDGYTKSIEEVMSSFELARQSGLTTVLLQGGLHPDLPLSYYVDLIKEARARYAEITPHFFSAPEIYHFSRLYDKSYHQIFELFYEAGQRTFPGGGAEILSERVRRRISPKKMAPGAWIAIHKAAHEVGIKSTATMMYGHIETGEDILEHLESLRTLQDETQGFTAFIPWSYKRIGNPLGRRVKEWAGREAYLRMISFSRLYLDNFPHIQASWFSEGRDVGIEALDYGADDFGGLVLEEEVHRATDFINKTHVQQVISMIHQAGFDAAQRTTLYDVVKTYPIGSNLSEKERLEEHAGQYRFEDEVRTPVLTQNRSDFAHVQWSQETPAMAKSK